MGRFIKKALYFGLIYNLVFYIIHNIKFFPKKGTIYQGFIDFWTLLFMFIGFVTGFIFLAIIYLLSKKYKMDIYDSNKMIGYIAFTYCSFEGLSVIFFEKLWENNDLIGIIVTVGYFLLIVVALYYFWKYRIEIASGVLITNILYYKTNFVNSNNQDYVTKFFSNYTGITQLSDHYKGMILLFLLFIYLAVLVFLRKKGVYDYRNRQELWQEQMEEGPYKKVKIINFNKIFKNRSGIS
ncbi:MAG TPA: hypothetical protein VKY40_08145 [Halanaerobiales bacterium]|nr:hypothetical protein [Halanaerobiales bacterium]